MDLIRKGIAAKILGVTPARVSQLLRDGALREVPGTKMLSQEAVQAYRRTMPPKPALSEPKPAKAAASARGKIPAAIRQQAKANVDALPDDQIPDYQTSRERREHYTAEQVKLLVDQQRGALVPLEQVKRDAFAMAKAVREALINIPDRVANQLAGETDPAAVHQLLSNELIGALGQLADG